jgi:hypothetical protein
MTRQRGDLLVTFAVDGGGQRADWRPDGESTREVALNELDKIEERR